MPKPKGASEAHQPTPSNAFGFRPAVGLPSAFAALTVLLTSVLSGGSQEGCNMSTVQQVRVVNYLRAALLVQ